MQKIGVSYYSIRSQLKTGDLIFFRGSDEVSNLISKVEKSLCNEGDFTHVGMVIMSDSFPIGHPQRLISARAETVHSGELISTQAETDYAIIPYVFESTASGPIGDGAYNVDCRSFLGIQLRNLDEVMEKYDNNATSHIGWGKLSKTLAIDCDRLLNIFRMYNNTRYDVSIIDLLAAGYPKLRWLRKLRHMLCCNYVDKWQFCSELVTNMYIQLGILPDTIIAKNILPVDYIAKEDGKTTFGENNGIPILFSAIERITVFPKNLNDKSVA